MVKTLETQIVESQKTPQMDLSQKIEKTQKKITQKIEKIEKKIQKISQKNQKIQMQKN